jgi:heme iron utilization protein
MSQKEEIQAIYQNFTNHFESVILCTVSVEGIPNASYAPFVMDEAKNVYIFVSGLSTHTRNLHSNPRVSILFIDDESKTEQIFARRRLIFDCTATLMKQTPEWTYIADKFETRFGEIIKMLRSLPDFRIFKLTPQHGQFVTGFGAAYKITGDDLNHLIHQGN